MFTFCVYYLYVIMYTIDLEKFLEKNNLRNKDLAEFLGYKNANMISMILKGQTKMPQFRIKAILDAGIYDTSMIKEVKKYPNQGKDTVTMSREVFNSIQQLVDTINSQQRTIESQQETIKANMGGNAQVAGSAVSADVG